MWLRGGAEAGLELAMHGDPALILLDVMLPKMNGFDICKTLRAENRTPRQVRFHFV